MAGKKVEDDFKPFEREEDLTTCSAGGATRLLPCGVLALEKTLLLEPLVHFQLGRDLEGQLGLETDRREHLHCMSYLDKVQVD